MKKSQIAVCSALGVAVVLVVGAVAAARLIVAQIATGAYAGSAGGAAQLASPASRHPALAGFDRIDARGNWDVTLTQGQAFDVRLDYPQRISDEIDAHVDGDRLVLSRENHGFGWFGSHSEHVKATIVMPTLAAVDLAGAAQLELVGFSGDALSITASGAAKIHGRGGHFGSLQITVSGAGDVDLGELPVDDARVTLSGTGDVLLDMHGGSLSGSLSGIGKLQYHGTVQEQKVVTAGFTRVQALDR